MNGGAIRELSEVDVKGMLLSVSYLEGRMEKGDA